MSYAHYWIRVLEFDRAAFARAVQDVRIIMEKAANMRIYMAGPSGFGKPDLTSETIAFNGMAACGHRFRDLGHPFPSATATGVEDKEPPYDAKLEPYNSGPYLDTRVCNGTCAGEPFVVDRKYIVRDWERAKEPGRYHSSCATDYKPYDLVVTAALVRIKEHLGEAITVSTEDPEHGFDDAKRLCRELFGWSDQFEIQQAEAEIVR